MTRQLVRLYGAIVILPLALVAMGFFEAAGTAPASRAAEAYLRGIDSLDLAVSRLRASVERSTPASRSRTRSRADLRSSYEAVRRAYKRIELFVEYFDPAAAAQLNAALVLKINTSDPRRGTIEPRGLQVIEEMIYDRTPERHAGELLSEIAHVERTIAGMRRGLPALEITDRHLFEAMRSEVVRVMVLGIAGFDTPASGNAIAESAWAMEGVRDAAGLYAPSLDARSAALGATIDRRTADAIVFLRRNRDFDSFDRLRFIREYGDRLYGDLLDAHIALGIETFSQSVRYNEARRYEARSIFDRGILSAHYYSSDARDHADSLRDHLGRLLFFDPILSGDDRRACASCHQPEMAFTDGRATSMGIHGSPLARNAPTLLNAAFQSSQFHDGRSMFLEQQIEQVLYNQLEMGSSFEAVIGKLQRSPEYRRLFSEAFRGKPDTGVCVATVRGAIAGYIRTLVALSSPFDRYMRRESDRIAPAVARGFNLFMGKAQCATCHFAPVFNGTVPPDYTDTEFEVLGTVSQADLRHPHLDPDPGRFAVFRDSIHMFGFKTPTIRNAELTGPYMHNGVFRTLEEVVEFYDRGGGAGLGLDVPTQTLPPDRLNLTAREKRDLVAFVRSLTDTVGFSTRPSLLPTFPERPDLADRPIGGAY